MTDGVRLSIAGAGHWHAPRHVEAFVAAGATVVAVQDDSAAAAHRWAARLGCPAEPTLDGLLAHEADLVLAMPRHRTAPEVIARLVEHGTPFVVEKPAAAHAADLWPLVHAAEARGRFAAVPLINRYSAFWDQVGRLRSDGLLDPTTVARFRIVNGSPERYVEDDVAWVLDPAVSGGGALRNLGPHAVDAFLSLAVGEVSVLGAALSHRQHGLPVEEHAMAILRDETGLIGLVEVGYSGPDRDGTDHEWALTGAGSSVRELHDVVEVSTAGGSTTVASPSVSQRYRIFAADVVERLRDGRPAPVTLRAACQALDVIDRIYAAAGTPVVAAHGSFEGEVP
ncbi:Gfo/Idh/MocA family protein [Jiangella alkaliphila]|uniref:Predicted dehydrogenase n=1 Tax=Jiangella alkaliphila TaxID=419479 RepID=A0A1H2J6V1_9ACTN|nr:Gfo/Idh/MocA family oxidoreductase [Jiangella alkaliphila]SDU52032.1 Predicted dehydrogenase [Jiangella alkaliphila]